MADADSDVDMSPPKTPTQAPYSPGDPFIAFEKIKETKVNGNISKATEKAFDKERKVIAKREQIAEEYSRALDEATSCVQELGLGNDISQLFGIGTDHTGLSQSIHATSQGTASSLKTSYAEAAKSHLPNISRANLPQKPCNPAPNHIPSVRKNNNRIFVRLLETHASRSHYIHHIHAVKAALRSKLGPEGDAVCHGLIKSAYAAK